MISMCCCKRFTREAEVSAFALSQNLVRTASSDVVKCWIGIRLWPCAHGFDPESAFGHRWRYNIHLRFHFHSVNV